MSLPSGYKRLEYIESDGSVYINTNYYANQNTEVICEAELLSGSLPVLFGHYQSTSNQFAAFFYGSKAAWSYWCGTSSGQISGTYTGRRRIVLNRTSLTVDDQSTTFSTSNFTATIPMFIFGLHQDNTMMYGEAMRLYTFQIKESGTLVRDYIPCTNASGVAGLWDDVNSVFYAPASGTFAVGELPAAHYTLKEGTVMKITSGKVLIDETSYDIAKGRTLVDGSGYDIAFEKEQYEVTVTFNRYLNSNPIAIDGVWYTCAYSSSKVETYTVDAGAVIQFEANRDTDKLTQTYIKLNGSKVATGSVAVRNYRYPVTGNVNIVISRYTEDLTTSASVNYNYFEITEL